jgi:HSP20 family protein
MWDWRRDLLLPSALRDFNRMSQRMARLLDVFDRGREQTGFPPVNVWSDEQEVILVAEIPGVRAGDLDVNVTGAELTLRGSREPAELKEGSRYLRQERGRGEFERTVTLPFDIDSDGIEASYRNGVLTVKLPRAAATMPRKIEIGG